MLIQEWKALKASKEGTMAIGLNLSIKATEQLHINMGESKGFRINGRKKKRSGPVS